MREMSWRSVFGQGDPLPTIMIRTAACFRKRKSEYHYDLLSRQTYVKTLDGKEQENFYDGEGLRAGLTENGKKTTFLFHNGEIFAECEGMVRPSGDILTE